MANHVSTFISFERISDAGREKLNEILSRVRPSENAGRQWFGDMWVDGKDGSPSYDDTDTFDWMCENIGPKWCYIEEVDDDSIRVISAWSWPEKGVEWLIDQIKLVDPKLIVSVQFEDEMPNFFGAYVYDADGIVDGFEEDWDELKERVELSHPELADLEEESDEWWDVMNENMYEILNEAQYEIISETVQNLLSEE